MSNSRSLKISGIVHIILLILCGLSLPAWSQEPISGRYTSIEGNTAELVINIGKPAPKGLIIHQSFPPEITIIRTSPKASGSNPSKGSVKWFLKKPQPGQLRISMTFKDNIPRSLFHAVVRCRHPKTGQYIDISIYP